jgi:transcriptional regulator with PAS, ATPase and Fis domain
MCLEVRERNFIKPCMEHTKNMNEVANELNMDYRTVAKRISRTKARLWDMMEGEFRKKR